MTPSKPETPRPSDPVTKPLCVFLLLAMIGCAKPAPNIDTTSTNNLISGNVVIMRPSVQHLQDEWYNAYTRDANAETSRMYDCISEIWERAAAGKSPAGGIACREACAMKGAINSKVDSAPDYIQDAQSFRLKDVAHSPCSKRRKP